MAEINFFVNWELWQQMTFVLAAAIVVVFFAGLVKLWWLSRFLKKHTILDEEKRARQLEMQKSGIPVGKRVDIPFGVRAIQSGVEVDGIWISRPGTPVEVSQSSPSFASSSTLEPENRPKGKEKEVNISGGVRRPTTTASEVESTPVQSPQPSPPILPISLSDQHIPTEAEYVQVRAFPLGAQPTYRPKGSPRHRVDPSTGEFLNFDQPESNTARPQEVETYVPTNSSSSSQSSASSHQRTMIDRSSTSSDEGALRSNMRYMPNHHHSGIPLSRTQYSYGDVEVPSSSRDYFSSAPAEQRRNPFGTPSSTESQPVPRLPLAASRPVPHRTYSNDAHANTTSRRVNEGFEILPAGTFSRSNSQNDMENGQSRMGSNNRAHKKSRDLPLREVSATR
ncbi:hypothetical protein AAE478_002333 [Parahypoxylon ruwenzoriense]